MTWTSFFAAIGAATVGCFVGLLVGGAATWALNQIRRYK